MSERWTGFRTFDVPGQLIEDIYCDDKIKVWDGRYNLYPNTYIELKDEGNPKHTAIGKIDESGQWIIKVDGNKKAAGITPRNREQVFALDALLDDTISSLVLTGAAGTGKTLLAIGAAMEKIEQQRYKRIIITRPMSYVGKYSLGALPGDALEKFTPYLANYLTNMECFVGAKSVEDMIDRYNFEIIPLQLIRGASYRDSFILADEMQVCSSQEVLALGTRVGENSKVVIMGDLDQRDEKIAREKTGIYKAVNSPISKASPIMGSIELQKCERSETSRLFAKIFEE